MYFGFLSKYKRLFAVILFLSLALETFRLLERYLVKILIDEGTLFQAGNAPDFIATLWWLAISFGILFAAKPIARWIMFSLINKMESNMIVDLKLKFYNHLLGLSHKFHTSHKTGSLISRLLRGGHALEGMTDTIVFNFAPFIIQLILSGVALLSVNKESSITMFVTSIAFVSYSLFLQSKQKKLNMEVIEQDDFEKARVADTFMNIDTIKYFGKEDMTKRKYETVARETSKRILKHWNFFRYLSSGQDIILSVGLFFLMLFPILGLLNNTVTIGELVFIYSLYGAVAGPLFSFVGGVRTYFRAMADFESLFQYYKIKNEIKDKPRAKKAKIKNGIIHFKDIKFDYGKRSLFNKFDLLIRRNEKIALVGHSGCGKSTLIKLLYRLHDLQRGQITIDGVDLRDMKQESLRSELSIVPQECILFDDTIYNNLKFVRPKATRDEVVKAMKLAKLYDIVQSFPDRENTVVGERGVKLSGGEKQRVSIARAILANKKILVLDEATSALDSVTEHEIQKGLDKLMVGRTSIIIAHRLSTIMKADRILVLRHGKIIEEGTHKQLIRRKGPYARLWRLQKGNHK